MSAHDLSAWTHEHSFHTGSPAAERGTRLVMWITLAAMVLEITAGWWFNSMALLADGWHMSSHAVAIGVAAFAYAAARRHAGDRRYAFGTWKIEVLAAFASAVFLLVVAALMVVGSVERLLDPQPIRYREAVAVAVFGLAVNLVCARVLAGSHDHDHGHGHGHGHGHAHAHAHGHGHDGHAHHHDLNLRSAYLHVLADAATSVLAIVALLGGWLAGWGWLDPAMGVVGALLVGAWARGLLRDTSRALLDREMDAPVVAEILEAAQAGGADQVADLHVWRVGRHAYACALTLVTHDPALTPDDVRRRLAVHEEVVHATIEVQRCTQPGCAPPPGPGPRPGAAAPAA